MNNYSKEVKNNKIIFHNKVDNTEIIVEHYDDSKCYDLLNIIKTNDIEFFEYIIKELKNSNDVKIVSVLYESIELENMLLEYGFKVLNYEYFIEYEEGIKTNNIYQVDTNLDEQSKKIYLEKLNEIGRDNYKYLYDNSNEYKEYNDSWFNKDFVYSIYRKNGEVIGIVDYKISANELYIRCLLGKEDEILEDILKNLLIMYKKDITISFVYIEKDLKKVIKNMNGILKSCKYFLCNNLFKKI